MSELTIEAKTENLDAVTAYVDEALEARDCPMRAQTQIDIAVEEIFVNIAYYAYGTKTGNAAIRIDFEDEPRSVRITFTDCGTPYNPLEKPDPDVTLSADDREIGGLGIYMVKKSMDSVNYEYRHGQNILEIVKRY